MRVIAQQPQGPVRVNWANPLTRGLRQGLVVTGVGVQSVIDPRRNITITGSGNSIAYSIYGVGLNGSNNSAISAKLTNYPDPTNISAATYLIFGYTKNRFVYSNTDGPVLLSHGSNRIGKTTFSNGSSLTYTLTTNNFEYPGATVPNIVTNYSAFSAAMCFQQGGTQNFYANGKLVATDSTTATTASLRYDNLFFPFEMGSYNGLDSQIGLFWNRVLSDSEIALLHQNPWQLFRTQTSISEKLLQQYHFTELIPTYPGLSNIRVPNRDERGMFVPKTPNVSLAGGTFNPAKQTLNYWYPLPGGGVYASSVDYVNHRGTFGGAALPQQTPYGIGLGESGTYQYDTGGRSISSPGGANFNKQTFVGLFHLYNVDKILTNGNQPALIGVRSYSNNAGAAIVPGRDGPGAFWKNDAGQRAIVISTSSAVDNIGMEITNIPNGLHCLVLVYEGLQPIRVYLNGKKIDSTGTFSNNYIEAYSYFIPNYYWSGLGKNRQDIGTVLFNGVIYKALNENDAIQLSKDPYSYFFKDAYTNKQKLLRSLTFDVPQAKDKSSYIQIANMPRKFVPVNMAHPLARNIKYASGPAWGDRDAVNTHLTYTNSGSDTGYWAAAPTRWWYERFGRFGKTWKMYNVYGESSINVPAFSWSAYTLLTIVNLEADNYPLWPEMQGKPISHISTGNTSFEIALTRFGNIALYWNANSRQRPYYVANAEVVPLRKLAVIVATVNSTGSYIYINGKLAGSTTEFYSSDYGTNTSYSRYRGSADNWTNNTAIETYFTAAWDRALSSAEAQQISENPWQIFESKLTDPLANKLLSVAADYPLIYTPTTSTRYIPLSTPSLVDRSNPLSKDIAFAATPVHGYIDGANPRIQWTIGDSNTQLRILTGRGGRAWNINRYFEVQSNISNPNAANWTVFCVVSLETNSHAEIPQGYILTGPGWGDTSVVRMVSDNTGRVTWGALTSKDPVPLRKLTTIAVVGSPSGTTMYMNGELQASTTTAYTTGTMPPRLLAYSGSNGPPSAWRPWLIYMSCGWYRALSDTEIQLLSQDPLKLFKRPDTTNHKILQGQYKYVETVDGRWIPYNEQAAYVNYSDLPRKYVPVNKSHPLAKDMLTCWTPSHDGRDAYNEDLEFNLNSETTNTNFGYNDQRMFEVKYGKYARYGKMVAADVYYYTGHRVQNFRITKIGSGLTALAFICIEQDDYPIVSYSQNLGNSTTESRKLINGGYSSQWSFELGSGGELAFGLPNVTGVKTPNLARAKIPLRKLVPVAVSVSSSEARFFINGNYIGSTYAAYSSDTRYRQASPYIMVGSGWGPFRHPSLQFYFAGVWTRALSDTEIASISQNPGQIFQQPSKFKNRYAEAVEAVLDISRKFLLFFG